MAPELLLGPAPLVRRRGRTGSIMWRVVLALSPVAALAVAAYGGPALLVLLACVLGSLAGEGLGGLLWGKARFFADGSAVLSGLLLALTLPPALAPGWAFAGGMLGTLVGRQLMGGLGGNLLNPALTGRLILSLGAPGALESAWRQPWSWRGTGFWEGLAAQDPLPLLHRTYLVLQELLSGALPPLPAGWPAGERLDLIRHAQDLLAAAGADHLLWPRLPGLMGEVSLLALLPGLCWLFTARLVDWRIPASILLVLPPALLLAAGGPAGAWMLPALYVKGTGLLLLISVFASDPVTTPLGQLAKFAYGLGVALGLVALLVWGQSSCAFWGLALGAGLLVPWLDRILVPRGLA